MKELLLEKIEKKEIVVGVVGLGYSPADFVGVENGHTCHDQN